MREYLSLADGENAKNGEGCGMDSYDKGAEFCRWGLFLGVVLGAAVFFSSGCQREQKHATSPPAPLVEVVEVIQKDVPIYSEFVATTDGFVNATIRAQVQGYLSSRTTGRETSSKKIRPSSRSTPGPSRPPWTRPRPPGIRPGPPGNRSKPVLNRPRPRWNRPRPRWRERKQGISSPRQT